MPETTILYSLTTEPGPAIPIILISAESYAAWLEDQDTSVRVWLDAIGFKPSQTAHVLVPGPDGKPRFVLQPVDPAAAIWSLGDLSGTLPLGDYQLDTESVAKAGVDDLDGLVLGWALGSYAFTRYKARTRNPARLHWPENCDRREIEGLASGIALARDLINTPAEEMGPQDLAAAATTVVAAHPGAWIVIIEADELQASGYPLVHAVGRASARPPCLIEINWAPLQGTPDAPLVTLVGKGVVFDTGGLDIKPSSAMRLMKKDMGGAATVLGLASAIMASDLPIRLRVLIPAVENAISANAFRPSDVFRSRKGLTVEIGNTDAEGRLILADALTAASSVPEGEKPTLLIDIATLTGAARTALGPDLPALFTADEDLASGLLQAGNQTSDPLWRLPLWQPYRRMIKSKIADLDNSGEGGMAGAVTAALFLESFVEPGTRWAHIDSYCWNGSSRPGRPEGGEALILRALYHYLETRFAKAAV